jgi:hypothetical protein
VYFSFSEPQDQKNIESKGTHADAVYSNPDLQIFMTVKKRVSSQLFKQFNQQFFRRIYSFLFARYNMRIYKNTQLLTFGTQIFRMI